MSGCYNYYSVQKKIQDEWQNVENYESKLFAEDYYHDTT